MVGQAVPDPRGQSGTKNMSAFNEGEAQTVL